MGNKRPLHDKFLQIDHFFCMQTLINHNHTNTEPNPFRFAKKPARANASVANINKDFTRAKNNNNNRSKNANPRFDANIKRPQNTDNVTNQLQHRYS